MVSDSYEQGIEAALRQWDWSRESSDDALLCMSDAIAAFLSVQPTLNRDTWADVGGDMLCVRMGNHSPSKCSALADVLWQGWFEDAQDVRIVEHWSSNGLGVGHSDFFPCNGRCDLYEFRRRFDAPPPLSWEDGYNPDDWKPKPVHRSLRLLWEWIFGKGEDK